MCPGYRGGICLPLGYRCALATAGGLRPPCGCKGWDTARPHHREGVWEPPLYRLGHSLSTGRELGPSSPAAGAETAAGPRLGGRGLGTSLGGKGGQHSSPPSYRDQDTAGPAPAIGEGPGTPTSSSWGGHVSPPSVGGLSPICRGVAGGRQCPSCVSAATQNESTRAQARSQPPPQRVPHSPETPGVALLTPGANLAIPNGTGGWDAPGVSGWKGFPAANRSCCSAPGPGQWVFCF